MPEPLAKEEREEKAREFLTEITVVAQMTVVEPGPALSKTGVLPLEQRSLLTVQRLGGAGSWWSDRQLTLLWTGHAEATGQGGEGRDGGSFSQRVQLSPK